MEANSDILDTTRWHPRTKRLYQHWLSIHPSDRLPGRQHFDPVAVPDLLPGLWLLDVERRPFRLRYRLVGTNIVQAIGREVTGMWLDDAHPHVRNDPSFFSRYERAAESRKPMWRLGKPRLWSHKEFNNVENLLLPFARDGTAVDMLMAFTVIYRTDGSVAY